MSQVDTLEMSNMNSFCREKQTLFPVVPPFLLEPLQNEEFSEIDLKKLVKEYCSLQSLSDFFYVFMSHR